MWYVRLFSTFYPLLNIWNSQMHLCVNYAPSKVIINTFDIYSYHKIICYYLSNLVKTCFLRTHSKCVSGKIESVTLSKIVKTLFYLSIFPFKMKYTFLLALKLHFNQICTITSEACPMSFSMFYVLTMKTVNLKFCMTKLFTLWNSKKWKTRGECP